MNNTRWLAGLAMVVLGCAAGIAAQDRQGSAAALRKPMALVGGMLIDGSGSPPTRNSVVLIRGDRIEKVGDVSSLPVPGGYDEISTEGMTVVPGLWDLHVHLIYNGHPNFSSWFIRCTVRNGDDSAAAEQMLMAGVERARSRRAAQAILA